MTDTSKDEVMVPVWVWVGLVLSIFGVIITVTGVYYLFSPQEQPTVLAETHPCLWWGGAMTVFGLVMLLVTWLPTRRGSG